VKKKNLFFFEQNGFEEFLCIKKRLMFNKQAIHPSDWKDEYSERVMCHQEIG